MATFESAHVHAVYDQIALDFSRTRHTRWPFCQRWLEQLPKGSVVLDAGCGNGKYLPVRSILPVEENSSKSSVAYLADGGKPETAAVQSLLSIGLDITQGLLEVAGKRGHEVVRGDCFDLSCWREGAFDHAISIAIIHHFSTAERRCEAVKQLILAVTPPRPSSPPPATPATATTTASAPSASPAASSSTSTSHRPGTILIAVWSLEQDPALVGVGSARRKGGAKKGAVPIALGLPADDASLGAASGTAGDAPRAHGAPAEVLDGGAEEEDGEEEEQAQDVFVPWALQPPPAKKVRTPKPVPLSKELKVPYTGPRNTEGKKRRKQLAKEAEARLLAGGPEEEPTGTSDVPDASALSLTEPTALPPPPPPTATQPPAAADAPPAAASAAPPPPTFHRYYHLFRHGELSGLVVRAARELGAVAVDRSEDKVAGILDDAEEVARVAERGWVREVALTCESWERENWAAQIEVKWVWRG